MDLNSLIDTAAPTPYGWMIMTQNEFDLNTMLSFQKQLLSLSRALGTSKAPAPVSALPASEVPAGELVTVGLNKF